MLDAGCWILDAGYGVRGSGEDIGQGAGEGIGQRAWGEEQTMGRRRI